MPLRIYSTAPPALQRFSHAAFIGLAEPALQIIISSFNQLTSLAHLGKIGSWVQGSVSDIAKNDKQALFCRFGSLSDAVKVFNSIESKVDPLYHTLLKGYAQQCNLDGAIKFFVRTKHDAVEPVVYNYSNLLKACADNFDARRGKEVHAQLILTGLSANLYAMSNLMNLYAKCGMVDDAHKVFERMPVRSLVCWNTVIAGFAQNGMSKAALDQD